MKPTQPPEGRTPLEILDAIEVEAGHLALKVRSLEAEVAALRAALERQEPERVERVARWLWEDDVRRELQPEYPWEQSIDHESYRTSARWLLRALEGGEP